MFMPTLLNLITLLLRLMFSKLASRVIFVLSATAPPYDASKLALMSSTRPVEVLLLVVFFHAVLADLLVENIFQTHILHLLDSLPQT